MATEISAYGLPRRTAPPERIERSYRIFFAAILLVVAVFLLGAAVAAVADGLTRVGAGGEELGLNALAAIMAVSWMPMFMPVLFPIVGLIIAALAVAVLTTHLARRLVGYLSHQATVATLSWRHAHPTARA
jgi:hypothetical protein